MLKRLLTTEAEYERWDRLLLQKTLDSMSNVVYCPNCVIGCMEDDENNAQCPKCSFIFCSFCKGPCHPGKKCLTPEEKIQLRKVYIGSLICSVQFILRKETAPNVAACYDFTENVQVSGRMTEKEMAQELFNIRQLYKDAGCARNAEWPSPKLKGATKWCAETVASSSALPAARPSVVISISGRPLGHPVSFISF